MPEKAGPAQSQDLFMYISIWTVNLNVNINQRLCCYFKLHTKFTYLRAHIF